MLNAAFVALFGALGALARFACSKWLPTSAGTLPWATLLVNGLGSFLLGLLTGWCLSTNALDERWRIALATGFLGSFTTFSTFSTGVFSIFRSGFPPYA